MNINIHCIGGNTYFLRYVHLVYVVKLAFIQIKLFFPEYLLDVHAYRPFQLPHLYFPSSNPYLTLWYWRGLLLTRDTLPWELKWASLVFGLLEGTNYTPVVCISSKYLAYFTFSQLSFHCYIWTSDVIYKCILFCAVSVWSVTFYRRMSGMEWG